MKRIHGAAPAALFTSLLYLSTPTGQGGALAQEPTSEAEYLESIPPEVAAANLSRRLEEGDLIPEFELPVLGGGRTISRKELAGQPSILIFFALDNPVRRERAEKLLAAADQLRSRFPGKIKVFGICSHDESCRREAVEALKGTDVAFPLLFDEARSAYTLFGIFMMPEALIVSPEGKLLAKVSPSGEIEQTLEAWFRFARGEIDREALARVLTPERAPEKSPEEKEYLHHLNLGRVMLRRGIYPQAASEFAVAAGKMPEATEPLLELGFVRLKMKQWAEGEKLFLRVLERDPDDMKAVAGLGLALHGQGKNQEALPELEDAASLARPFPQVLSALAEIVAANGDKDRALTLYARAVKRWEGELADCQEKE